MNLTENRVIVALGGNAFVRPDGPLTMQGQFEFARRALACMEPLLAAETRLVITHGNGPQVGSMLIRVEAALGEAYSIPLEVCVAESEGELGYVLQQTLHNLLVERGQVRPIAGLVTQIVVDGADPAFKNPSKPIGPFYTQTQAEELQRNGFTMREDAGRGYRRVVPSPMPKEIVDVEVIRQLLEAGVIVVALGGGGIPVVRENGGLKGVEAVVDKDHASALLGRDIDANLLVILTGVPCAYRDFNTARQAPIGRIGVAEAGRLVDEGHFAPGSMRPKMAAAVEFASRPGCRAIICDPPSLASALQGHSGTIVEFGETT